MQDFSINATSKKIYFSKTKKYFEEVIKSYNSKNFRSAIVMLYSILICDLVYKLQELKDRFNDESAIKIIEEIEQAQKDNPSNPDWENRIVELIKERTGILRTSDYINIIMLKKHRHLCSHPVLEDNYELYQPNEETTLAHIRNISEGVFIKPPIFTKRIIHTLLQDIKSVGDIFINGEDEPFQRYLNSKYFKHASPVIIKSIFRSLWKIVYRLEDKECDENRVINSKTIRIIYKNNEALLLESIDSEPDYFSDISHGRPMYFMIGMLSQNHEIFMKINESARVLIKKSINKDRILKSMAWFLFPDLKTHLAWIKEEEGKKSFRSIHLNTVKAFYQPYKEAGLIAELFDLFIWLYAKSKSDDISKNRFSFILFVLPHLKKENFLLLLEAIEENVYNRNSSVIIVKRHGNLILGEEFNYSKYPHFYRSLPS